MREYHVRICEGLGVKFPGSTRQTLPKLDVSVRSVKPPIAMEWQTWSEVGSGPIKRTHAPQQIRKILRGNVR